MKLYVIKNLRLSQDRWEVIDEYMKKYKLHNFTELVWTSILLMIKQQN